MRNLRMGFVVVVACMGVLTATAAARVVRIDGHPFSLMVHGAAKPSSGGSTSGPVLTDRGGPVLTSDKPYLIYWAPPAHPISQASQKVLNQYMLDVAADSAFGGKSESTTNVYSVLQQQYGATYSQTFNTSQAIVDTQSYPAKQSGCKLATGMTACVTDSSLRAEILRLIGNGALPAPGKAGQGTTPIFFMITPVDVNVCGAGGCASSSFCAYHTYFTNGPNQVLYASVPFDVFAASTKGCQTDGLTGYQTPVGSNGDEAYNVADDLSHELSETVTDPLINAWYSSNGLEVGDLCEAYGATANTQKGLSPNAYAPAVGDPSTGTLYDQVIDGNPYYNQTEYSNSSAGCVTGVTSY